jgi:circadian clock protein KaiC
VLKFRGSDFQPGKHSMRLTEQGMEVFPRLVPERFRRRFRTETIASGVPALDEMLSGGLERGTVTIFTGPSGVGKTTVGVQFMKEAAGRGEHSVLYLFEEDKENLIHRCEAINIPIRSMIDRGTLAVEQIEPLLYSPDEFARRVRREVEEQNARIVMLDSLAGYRLCIHQGEDMTPHIHALVKYLKNMGATTLLVNELETITGKFQATELGISYLADNIIFLRYLEIQGELRKAIGVLKKRLSEYQKSLRELAITRYGIRVGEPLTGLRGILTGTPEMVGRLPRRNWTHSEPEPPPEGNEADNGRIRTSRRRRQDRPSR